MIGLADYKWTAIPYGMIIDGGIMPRRENSKLLRGEDLCFLWEATSEWQYVSTMRADSMEMTFKIDANRYKNIINRFRYWAALGTSLTTGKPMTSNSGWSTYYEGALSPLVHVPSKSINLSRLSASAADFATGKPMRSADVSKMFDDQNIFRYMQIYNPQTSFESNPTFRRVKEGDASMREWGETAPYVWYYKSKVKWNDTGTAKTGTKLNYYLTDGTFEFDMKDQTRIDLINNAYIWVQFFFQWYTHTDDEGGWESHLSTRTYPIHATRVGTRFKVNAQTIINDFNSFMSSLDIDFDPTNYNGGCYEGYCTVDAKHATVTLGNRMTQ